MKTKDVRDSFARSALTALLQSHCAANPTFTENDPDPAVIDRITALAYQISDSMMFNRI